MNLTLEMKDPNCSASAKVANFSRLALVIQAVLFNLSLLQVEGSRYPSSNGLGTKFLDDISYYSGLYPPHDYYPDSLWHRPSERMRGSSRQSYDTGYGGWFGKNSGGEREWAKGRHDARRHGQISSGFSNSYNKNEKGDSTIYFHDDLGKSALLDYTGLGSNFEGNGGGHNDGKYSLIFSTREAALSNPSGWYNVDPHSYFYDDISHSRSFRPKKSKLYVVPTPKQYFIDKPPKKNEDGAK